MNNQNQNQNILDLQQEKRQMGSQICPKLYQNKNQQKEKTIKVELNNDSIQTSLNLRRPQTLDKLFQIRVQQNTDMSLRVKNHLTNEQLREKYMQVNFDERRFYEMLSVDMNSFYMDLTKESIQMLMNKKANEDQIKIRLCQNILIFSLDVFKVLGQNRNFDYELHTFQSYSETQTKLAEYLKNKYPRSDKLYYPGDLAKRFTDFNMTGKIQNDFLNNSQTYFTDRSELGVIKTLKIFFNKVFNELNQKFPKFEKLLQQKIFHYEQDGKQIHLHYYINRKIPENVPKFQIDDSLSFPITSPELFRTIIKWTEYLEDLFSHPEQNLKKMETFKLYNVRDDVINQTIINAEEVTGLFAVLLKRFTAQKSQYRNYQKLKTDRIHQFNRNLLKILFSQEIMQKYIPKQQANVMKYAYFNTRMVTWVIKEMLVYFIQKLIHIGSQIQLQSKIVNVNLTNFMVSDLLRSKVIGTKKQIMFVFNNILNQQKQGQLRVIKIKNRLGTLLNDVMVIFLMSCSFIVCELQLVLSEGQKVNERIKNIEFMHHYLYELERTPYGVLTEVSSNLGYHDTKISFCQKIQFQQIFAFQKCLSNPKQHQIKRHRLQRLPIICMNCCKYYDPYNCMFEIKECIKCHTFQCSKCETDTTIKYQIDQIFYKQFYRQLRETEFNILEYINSQIFIEDRIKLDKIRRKPGSSLKSKAVHHFLNDKEYNTIINNEYLKRQKQTIFIVAKFTGSILKIKQFYFDESKKQYVNCFKSSEVISEVKPAMCSQFDFIMFFQTQKMISVKHDAISNYHLISLEKINLEQIETFYVIKVPQFHQVAFLLKCDKKNAQESLGSKKKQCQFNSIQDRLKKQPEQFIFVRQNLVIVNQAIDCQKLRNFFDIDASTEYKTKLKQINLSNNLIKNASPLFLQCPNLKKVSLSRNNLRQLNLKEFRIPEIQTLILNENQLQSVDGIQNLSSLLKLNLNDNYIMNIKILKLSKIEHICISNNKFDSIQWLEYSSLPSLKILEANSTGVSVTRSHQDQSLTFKFPELRQLLFNDNIVSILNVESAKIQYLSANKCEMDRIHLKMKNVTYLSLANNEIQNLEDILSSDMTNLKRLKLSSGGNMPLLPIIHAEKLSELDISNCKLFNVNSLEISKIPQIEIINISQNNEVRSIPKMQFPELRIFNTKGLRLKNINCLNESKLIKVEELILSGSGKNDTIQAPNQAPFILEEKIVMELKSSNQQAIVACPAFNFPKLKKLYLSIFNFTDLKQLSNSSLVELNELCLEQMKLKSLPRLKQIPALKSQQSLQINNTKEIKSFSNLRTLILRNIQAYQSQQFYKSNFSNLQSLQLNNTSLNLVKMVNHRVSLRYIHIQRMPIQQIPVLDCPKCQKMSFISCKIKNIFELEKYNMTKIKQLDLSSNNIKELPNLGNLKTLTSLNLKKNQIQSISSLSLTKEELELKFSQNLSNVFALAEKQISLKQLKQSRKLKWSSLGKNPFQIEGLQILDEILVEHHQPNNEKQYNFSRNNNPFDYHIFEFLEKLDVSSNNITSIDYLRFKMLKYLNINYNPIKSLSNLADEEDCHLQNLLQFELIGLNNLTDTELPVLKLERAEQITIYDCNITNFRSLQNWSINQVHSIIIGSAQYIQIPILKNLTKLRLFICTSLGQNRSKDNAEQIAIEQIKYLKNEVNVDFEKQLLTLAQKKAKSQQFILDNTNQSLSNLSEQSHIIQFDLSLMSLWKCPNIKKIMFKNIQMQYLPKLCINQLQNLLIIRCSVQKLDKFNDSFLPNLNNLVFHKVTHLKYLQIAEKVIKNGSIFAYDCEIQQVCPFLDCKCKNIVLKNNKISVMGLMKLRQTSNLSIQNNDMKSLSFLQRADKLKKIVVRRNKITEFPELKFPELTELNLNENYLKYLDLKQENFPQLEYLIASHNRSLSKVSKIMIESIHEIDMSYNALRDVTFFSPHCKIYLNQLNLSNNYITNIQYLPPSKEIKLNNNPLMNMKWLTNTIAQSLQYLNLSETQFENFQFFGNINLKFQSLIKLDLSYNKGTSFPCFQQYFSHLLQLNLSHNNFESINEFPNGNFPSLERLNVSFNKLKTFTTSLRKIKVLNLQSNNLKQIQIKSTSSIRQIKLDDNNLESVQFIKNFPCLNTLTASNNMITQIPCLMYNDNLKYLILEGNPLHKFEPFFQTKFENLDQLKLTYSINPMLLPRQIEYIQSRMETVNIAKKKYVIDRYQNVEKPQPK